MTKNVWMLNHYAKKFPMAGGTRHHGLARGLHRHDMDTTIFTAEEVTGAPNRSDGEPSDGVTFVQVPTRSYQGNGLGRILNMAGFAWRTTRLGWHPERHGLTSPDVVIGSTPHPFAALAAWAIARHHHVPFILEVRDLWPESMVAILGMSRRHPLVLVLGAMEKFLYSHADRIVGVLEGIGDHAQMRVGRRAPEVTWVPNGVSMALLPDVTPVTPPGGEFRVVYTGSHGPPNSLDTVLAAAEILQHDDDSSLPPIRFDLYGDGVVKKQLIKDAQRRGLTNVHFHDPVPKDEVYRILAGADATVLLLPRLYLWRFGISPNKLFDYLAAARPTILAVDAPGDPVTKASAGFTATGEDPVDLAAKIRQLRALPLVERQAMGMRGREYVAANHDMPRLADRLAAAINSTTRRR
ncbi:MAG: glycosyltransferase family 4 protein [Nakamurella sp.]